MGNIGDDYQQTRHNIGFDILDAFAKASNICFKDNRYGAVTEYRFKGRIFILLKPATFMNLSGKAVHYWMQKENIPVENLLVICDDMALPLGKFRLKPKGSDGGHNGLKNICELLGTAEYARLRVGIGSDFQKGFQTDFVLGKWTDEENKALDLRYSIAIEIIKSFGLAGTQLTMTNFNNK